MKTKRSLREESAQASKLSEPTEAGKKPSQGDQLGHGEWGRLREGGRESGRTIVAAFNWGSWLYIEVE